MLVDQILSGLLEQREYISVNILKVVQDISGRGADDVFWLRDSNSNQLHTGGALDILNQILGLLSVEGDALAFSPGASSSP